MKCTISLAQMEVHPGRLDKNVKTARRMIEQAAKRGSDLVLLPELWSSGYDLPRSTEYAAINQSIMPQLARWALEFDLGIGGSLILADDSGCYNTFTLFLPGSPEPFSYRKIHLFRRMQEDAYFLPGDRLTTVDTPWGRFGLATCYDLRFPELFRAYALKDAAVILLCAQWPQKRIAHWRTLLRARAIENQYFVAAVNAAGGSEGDPNGGCSMIINPWGDVLSECENGEDLITTSIDLDQVDEVRQKFPVLGDRRPDIYTNEEPPE